MKLKDILSSNLSETSVSVGAAEIGYLWPFSTTDKHASDWEDSRLANIFRGSLKGWMVYTGELGPDTIMKNHNIDHLAPHKLAGEASDEVKYSGHEKIKDMYDEKEVDGYLHAHSQPDPEKKYTIPKVSNPNKKY